MSTYDRLYIGGDWVEPAGADVLTVTNPATGEVVGTTPEGTTADIDRAVEAARSALTTGDWVDMPAAERAAIMRRLHDLIIARSDELANLITAEVGAPLLFSHFGQVGAAGMVLDYFTNLTAEYPFEEVRQDMLGPGPQGASRRGRGHHPLERAAVHHHVEVRSDAGVGLGHGAQAGARDAARRVRAGRDGPRGRRSRRRAEHRPRRP
jgi:hypothetical protein